MSDSPLVVDCAGEPRERGRAHGEQLRERIHFGLDRLHDEIAGLESSRGDPDRFLREWLAATTHLDAIERFTPDLAEELRGIADGAGAAFEQVLSFNLMDEMWSYDDALSREPDAFARARPAPGCSVIAVHRNVNGNPMLAQTMDLGPHSVGTQAVLRLDGSDGLATIVATRAGMVGLMGANSTGVGVVVNALTLLDHTRSGLPVAFVVRGILEQRTLDDATSFVRRVPHASGQAYHVGSPEGFASFECSAGGVVPWATGAERAVHTNHPLATRDLTPGVHGWPDTSRSHERLSFLLDHLDEVHDPDDAEALLADRSAPICFADPDDDSGLVTVSAISIELSAPPAVRIATGAPSDSAFEPVAFAGAT